MNIDGGTISFEALWESGSVERGLKTTEDLVKNFTSLTVKSGADIDAEYKKTAAAITRGFETIGNAINANQSEITKLTNKYNQLRQAASDAFMRKTSGGDAAYRRYNQEADAIQRQISALKQVEKGLQDQDQALVKLSADTDDHKNKLDNATGAQVRFRTEILNVKQKMMELAQAGKQATPEYAELTEEAKRLSDAMYAANQQVKILTSVKGQALQGIVSGLSGIAGAASVAQGAVGLFADKNEELQQIMLKVQSLMAITIGLQQVSQMLHSTSAFRLTFLAKAQSAYTASMAVSNRAAQMGVIANVGLAASFRAVGAAIKAIPVFGWILAGVSALIGVVSIFSSKAREAKKATEEFNKKVVETAAKPIATITELSLAWSKLGDNIKAKEKFIEDNKEKFNSLGVSIKGVSDAEKLLIDNKTAFIESQILKAKAMAATELASEKYKEALLKAQERENVTGGSEQSQIRRRSSLSLEQQKLEGEANKLFAQAAKFTEQEQIILAKIGQSTNRITEGSIAELEKNISKLKDKYKNAATDLERNDLLKQIKIQEALLAKIDLSKDKKTKTGKDPFTKDLEEKKKNYQEYFKWLNSTDEIIRNSASKTFSELLKGGGSYKEYLNNQIASLRQLQDEGTITAQQLSNLKKLTTALQDETHKTVMQEFEKGLQTELENARSIFEMLSVIEQKRKDLDGDKSGLREQKGEVLDKQQEDVVKKQEDETRQLIKSYSNYLNDKINFELQYADRKKQVDKAVLDAETALTISGLQGIKNLTDKQKRQLDLLIANLKLAKAEQAGFEKDREKYENQTGNQEYDNLLQQYKSFEQKKTDTTKEFEEKRKVLTEQMNSSGITESQHTKTMEALQELEKDYKKSLSNLSVEILQQSDTWQKLFTDLDTLTVSEMLKMKRIIEENFNDLSKTMTPEALKAIRDQLDQVTEKIRKKNPFAALANELKNLRKNSENGISENFEAKLAKIGASAAEAANMVGGLAGNLSEMFDAAGNDKAAQAMGTVQDVMSTVSNIGEGFAKGGIIGGIGAALGEAAKWATKLFQAHDKSIEKSIQKHAEAVKQLQKQYDVLERATDKALGSDKYTSQKAELDNLKKQQAEYNAMSDAERTKKKADSGKIEEYEKAAYDNAMKMLDIIDKVREDIIGGTAASIANDLGNAFIDAFAAGENAMDAFKKKADDIVAGIMRKMLIQKLLEQPIGSIIDTYSKKWLDNQGNFIGFDAVMRDADQMGSELKGIGEGFAAAMENLPDEIKKYFVGTTDPQINSLSGAIKGASQESINLLAGQTNAVRVNQVEGIEIMRNSLIQLTMINANTSRANNYLEQIEKNTSNQPYDPLRSQGITG